MGGYQRTSSGDPPANEGDDRRARNWQPAFHWGQPSGLPPDGATAPCTIRAASTTSPSTAEQRSTSSDAMLSGMSASSLARKLGRPATYADLQSLPEGVKGEIIDGELYVQPRPRAAHARAEATIVSDIQGPYDLGRGGPGGWWILPEPGIELPGSPEFSPDIAGWRRQRLPELPQDRSIQVVPDWICEILSPSTRGYDLLKKRPFYARSGVAWLWYVDVEARTVTVSRLAEGAWVEVAVHGEDERARLQPFVDVEINFALWWPGPAKL